MQKRQKVSETESIVRKGSYQDIMEGQSGERTTAELIKLRQDMLKMEIIEKTKALYMRLPRERDEVFAVELDWQLLISQGVLDRVVRPWVAKKIKEYLGVEEQAMIKLVLNQLASGKCTAENLLAKVGNILDEVADQFVFKLWQVLLFEHMKIVEGI